MIMRTKQTKEIIKVKEEDKHDTFGYNKNKTKKTKIKKDKNPSNIRSPPPPQEAFLFEES